MLLIKLPIGHDLKLGRIRIRLNEIRYDEIIVKVVENPGSEAIRVANPVLERETDDLTGG